MNAPLRNSEAIAGGALQVFAFFHLNLAFSSIEEDRRSDVIARCYWPLLQLAERAGPIGMELSGYTLEEIATRDPEWIGRAKNLIERGRIELIGSGFSQMIGPLVPARVTQENLRLGNEAYARLLGARPRMALVNEQAYSAGLVGLYRDAGYDAIIMDWENPAAHHPEWPAETQYLPQRALGVDGRDIALIWSNTTLFQQLQRLVHGDIALENYLSFVRRRVSSQPRALCLYASDAEIFGFRPGRFKTEEILSGDEWLRLETAFTSIAREARMVRPSEALSLLSLPGAGRILSLESPECPVPVKKQRKYNLARWAVTGRDNLAINAACQRIYEGMLASQAPDWKELCALWASDFRTHVTEKRWNAYRTRLEAAEAKWSKPSPPRLEPHGDAVEDRYFEVKTPWLSATLDRRRGLALARLKFKDQPHPVLGGLPHGYFEDIALAADWYTGDCVFEAPGEHKLTDLEWCEAKIAHEPDGSVLVSGQIDTPKGPDSKNSSLLGDRAARRIRSHLRLEGLGQGRAEVGPFHLAARCL